MSARQFEALMLLNQAADAYQNEEFILANYYFGMALYFIL